MYVSFEKLGIAAAMLGLTIGCGAVDPEPTPDPDPPPATSHSYRTTSNIGDLATWTIDGNMLTAEWKDIAPVTGAIERTYQLTGLCGSPNADFGYRTCLVDGDSICTAGTLACAAGDGPQDGDTLSIFEVPGMALVAEYQGEQLHAGFATGDCQSIGTDDYTYINVGLGQSEAFGLFRTDADFTDVHHMDFGFSDDPDNQLRYQTHDPAGLVSLTAGACTDGVRDLVVDAENDKVRVMVTASGHLVLDKPEGQGGMLAINAANAATIEDFANKTWGGIGFPDDRPPEYVRLTTGAAANGRVVINSLVMSETGDITPATPAYISDGSHSPSLNESMLEPLETYASNQIVVDGSYAGGPSQLPGIFEVDPITGDETAIIGIGTTIGGKTMLFGSVVNVYEDSRNGVKGNFILVEQ